MSLKITHDGVLRSFKVLLDGKAFMDVSAPNRHAAMQAAMRAYRGQFGTIKDRTALCRRLGVVTVTTCHDQKNG